MAAMHASGVRASVAEASRRARVLVAVALCERSLVAMARSEWSQAEVLAERARHRRAPGRDARSSYATPLVCAVHARAALHRGDVSAARQQLVTAQRLRPLLTYALPHFAVQARIELARVHLRAGRPGRRQDAHAGGG